MRKRCAGGKKNGRGGGETGKKEKTGDYSGHYVIASSWPPERRLLKRHLLVPKRTPYRLKNTDLERGIFFPSIYCCIKSVVFAFQMSSLILAWACLEVFYKLSLMRLEICRCSGKISKRTRPKEGSMSPKGEGENCVPVLKMRIQDDYLYPTI